MDPYHARRSYLPLLMITLLNAAVPFTLISWGQQHVSSGFAGVSMAAVGLFVLPLAHARPGEDQRKNIMRFFDRVWRCAFVDWGTHISIQWIRIGMVRAFGLSMRGGLLCGKFHFHTITPP